MLAGLVGWLGLALLTGAALVIGRALPGGGVLAYTTGPVAVSLTGSTTDLYVVDVAGAPPVRLLRVDGFLPAYDWSGDGESIVFYTHTGDSGRFAMLEVFSGQVRDLTEFFPGSVASLDWSPDGTQVAFGGWRFNGTPGLYLLDVSTGDIDLLLETPTSYISPVWSPDGTQLAFHSGPDNVNDVQLLDPATGDVRNLSRTPTINEVDPVWSPDGRYVVFTAERSDRSSLVLYDLEADRGRVINLAGNAMLPVWLPSGSGNGALLAYWAYDPGSGDYRLVLYDVASRVRQEALLAQHAGREWVIAPDGAQLALARQTLIPVLLANLADGAVHLLALPEDHYPAALSWQPIPPAGP